MRKEEGKKALFESRPIIFLKQEIRPLIENKKEQNVQEIRTPGNGNKNKGKRNELNWENGAVPYK